MPARPETTHLRPGQPVPTPPDFPVQWATPDQARQLWTLDRMHFGDPMLPLAAAVWQEQVAAGFNRAAVRYNLPIRIAFLYLNGYLYNSFPAVGAPPDRVMKGLNALGQVAPGVANAIQRKVVAGMTRKYMAQVEPVMARLQAQWEHDWWPELQQHLAYWEDFDLTGANISILLAHLDESLARIQHVWDLHFQIIIPAFLALNQFEELYRELLGRDSPDDAFAAFRLLQGFDNHFLQADRALWQLGRQACTLPAVCQALERCAPAEVMSALAGFPEGQIFLAELQVYLDQYGRRGHKTDGLGEVSWLEDPTPVIQTLKDFLVQPDGATPLTDQDLASALQVQAAARERAVNQARQRLQRYPTPVRDRFETLLKAAQTAAFLSEEHNFWIDQQAMYQLRRVFLAAGQHLAAAGVLDRPADVFYLTTDELRATAASLPTLKRQAVVTGRRADLERFRAVRPPPALGTVPLMTPPDDPFSRTFSKIFGGLPIPADSISPIKRDVLSGRAGSPGVARGRARLIRTLAEADRLQPGEVLVAGAIMPPWTPLLSKVVAIITDTGGVLSHSALVAREYGIPAVVGTGRASATIRDGQMVEVDGNRGVVRLLDGSDG